MACTPPIAPCMIYTSLPETLHDCQNFFQIGERPRHIALTEAYYPSFVHNNDGAKTNATLLVPQAVGLRYLALGMPIGQFRERQSTHRGRPRPMRVDMIATDAQYLGLPLLQPAVIAPEGYGLLRSPTGEIKDVEREYDVLVPTVLAESNITLTH